MADQGRQVPFVEDEAAERDALRALLKVWEQRVEGEESVAWRITMTLDRRPERGMTSVLRAGLSLLVIPLAVAGYAGITALILPLDAVRSVLRRRGRHPRLVGLHALASERLLPARSEPLPATA